MIIPSIFPINFHNTNVDPFIVIANFFLSDCDFIYYIIIQTITLQWASCSISTVAFVILLIFFIKYNWLMHADNFLILFMQQ